MINWDDYKNKIVALHEEGLSSSEITSVLAKTNEEITPDKDRSVRSAIQRWREDGTITDPKREPAKILVFDIETAPLMTFLWNRFQKYVKDDMLIEDWYVICWSAKWLFEDEMISRCVTPEESKDRNDKRIVKDLWDLLDEADIVISHNGDKFDIKKMNGRFAKYGLNLPMPYRSIDTFKSARKRLSLPSLSLDYIANYFDVGAKHSTDFQLWLDCMQGDPQQLKRMQEYCDQDVKILEDVYLHLRPYIQPHPNLGLYIESDVQVCPSCGSDELEKEGEYATTVNLYDAFRCQECGSITRSRHAQQRGEERKHITSSTPR